MFKKLLIAGVSVFFIANTVKASDEQKVASKVQKVTVFLNGAQVTRTALVNISAGTYDLVFDAISPNLDLQSIQVQATGDFGIMSVKSSINYSDVTPADQQQIEVLTQKRKDCYSKITLQNNMQAIYQNEENMLGKNQVIAENPNIEISKLKKALDFQTERLTQLKIKEQAVQDQINSLKAEADRYYQQINLLTSARGLQNTNVVVSISSKTSLQSAFTISYFVNNASWYPSYDIKAKNVKSPLEIVYKANVSQNTGEDWKGVKLILSTGNPNFNNEKPELSTYNLNVNRPYFASSNAKDNSLSEIVAVAYGTRKYSSSPQVSMVENQTNVEFNITDPYSIINDGKPYQVEINRLGVDANYQYYAAPKLSSNVFLMAQVTDWSKYNLLSGEASLYFEGTYVGKSKIDTHSLSDTLNLSLGTDKNIVVTRTLEKGLAARQIIGSNKKETRNWLIEVKNRKNQPVNLLVEDQVPVSQNTAIQVETQETSGAKLDALTGKLSWNFLLNSQGDKKLKLKYQVKYPQNQSVIVQ